MTPTQLIRHFSGNITHAAKELGINRQTVWQWKSWGYIPFKSQQRVEFLTDGALKAAKK